MSPLGRIAMLPRVCVRTRCNDGLSSMRRRRLVDASTEARQCVDEGSSMRRRISGTLLSRPVRASDEDFFSFFLANIKYFVSLLRDGAFSAMHRPVGQRPGITYIKTKQLCSSCIWKPEKFLCIRQENMLASTQIAWTVATSPV